MDTKRFNEEINSFSKACHDICKEIEAEKTRGLFAYDH